MAELVALVVDGQVRGFGSDEWRALDDAVRQTGGWVRHVAPHARSFRPLSVEGAKRVTELQASGRPAFTHEVWRGLGV